MARNEGWGRILFNGVPVQQANVRATNGILHFIHSVLLPPERPRLSKLVALMESVEKLKTFADLARLAGVEDELRPGWTLLAPTNAAFARLPHGSIHSLMRAESKHLLRQLIHLHIVPSTHSIQLSMV